MEYHHQELLSLSEVGAIQTLAKKTETKHLLKHPLVETFLDLKRKKIMSLFYTWALIKILFFGLFTSLTVCEYGYKNNMTNSSVGNPTEEIHPIGYSEAQTSLRSILGIFIVFFLLVEILQLIVLKADYFRKPVNWVQILLIAVTSFLVFSDTLKWYPYRKRIAALILPILSFETLKEVTSCTKYAHVNRMLLEVIKYFGFYLFWYSILIFASSISLYLLFSETEGFSNARELTMRVFVMWLGEFDFNDSFKNDLETDTFFYIIELIVLLFFIFIIIVVLMNLLNGLAVYDTRQIRNDATVIELKSLTNVLIFWETLLLHSSICFFTSLWKKYFQILKERHFLFLFDPDTYELHYILSSSDRLTQDFGWEEGNAKKNKLASEWNIKFSKKILRRAAECQREQENDDPAVKKEDIKQIHDRIEKLDNSLKEIMSALNNIGDQRV